MRLFLGSGKEDSSLLGPVAELHDYNTTMREWDGRADE